MVYKITDAMSTLEGATRSARAYDLVIAPKIAHAVFAAMMDLFTWKLGQRVYGSGSSAALAAVSAYLMIKWTRLMSDFLSLR